MDAVLENSSSIGQLTAFIMMIPMLFRPLNQIANKFNVLLMGMVAAERVFKILDTDSVISNSGKIDASSLKGLIDYKNVLFSYDKQKVVIDNFNLSIKPGSKNAIVGTTGSGKSTLIKLLNRFYDCQSGSILIDGVDIKEYNLQSLRKNIGFVSQEIHLFSDTIYNNITLFNKNISLAEVENAAKQIGLHEFISSLPNGYNYNVLERGAGLSTGQRQLISFLRVYLKNPKILILDEATSSIDNLSEKLIQKATKKITENRTSIIIAHRLSTIINSDNIIVMSHGKLIEMGNHNELLKNNDGSYSKLYKIQLRKEKIKTIV
jgi:subfamily B ATP-binding cassette protein MsbA